MTVCIAWPHSEISVTAIFERKVFAAAWGQFGKNFLRRFLTAQ